MGMLNWITRLLHNITVERKVSSALVLRTIGQNE